MRLTVLTDNCTRVGTTFWGEPGLSYLIEVDGKKVLFDTGFSELCVRNADALGNSLSDLDIIILSHGHGDHTGGLEYVLEVAASNEIRLVTHPLTVVEKQKDGRQFGLTVALEKLQQSYTLKLSREPVWLSEHLIFLGEIPRRHSFELQDPLGERLEKGVFVPDDLLDDSALALRTDEGLTIITGCSHAGICNIIDYAREVCQQTRVLTVIGGFHLCKADEQARKTAEFFRDNQITNLYPCHCTSFEAKAVIHTIVPIHDVAVGTIIDLN